MHPVTSFFYFVGFVFLSIIFLHPVYLLTGIIGMVGFNLLIDRGQQLRGYLPFYLLTGIAVGLANPLFSHRGRVILFYFWDQPVTLEAIIYGVTMMLSLLSILIAFVAYNQVLTSGKFLFLFSRAFQKIGLLVMMSMRFVPLVKRRLHQIMLVQRTRGVDPTIGPLRKRMHDAVLILQIVVTWSLEEALQTSDSMKARGYGIIGKRGSYNPYRISRMDWIVLSVLFTMLAVCLAGWLMGYGMLPIYPRLIWPPFDWKQGLNFFAFVVFMLVPMFVEGRERWRWRESN